MSQWTTVRIGPAPHIAVDHMGTGDLVVFLHGIGGNKRNWVDNLPAFAAHWHAVAWDARGYGESDDYEGPLTFTDFSHDVARVLDHFGAKKAHIVGLSMGGRIAQDFAALHVEIESVQNLGGAELHRDIAHPDDGILHVRRHHHIPIEAKKIANTPSITMTKKIPFTTDEVVCWPSDSALPCTASPSTQATIPITAAITGALMMPTVK